MTRLPLITLTMLALAACAVGPDFERPASPEASAYDAKGLPGRTEAAGKEGSQDFVVNGDIPQDWWTLFHAKDLSELIAEGIRSNPDLEAASASLRVAMENEAAGSADLFPSFSLNASSTREKTTGAQAGGKFPGSIFTLHNASVNVSYGLDIFGGTRRAIEELEAKTSYQDYLTKAAYLSLTSNIVTTAVQEASLRAQVSATEDIIHDQNNELDILKQEFDAGAISEVALLAQETTLEQTKATLPPLEQQLAITRHQLTTLLGRTPDKDPKIVFDLANLTLPDKLPLTLPVKLIEQRPDILAAEANLHAASAAIGVAVADRLPGIQLTGSIGTQANKIDKLFAPGGGIWSLGDQVSETIFDAGALEHKEKASRAEFDVAKASYRKTVLSALADVANVLSALQADAASYNAEEKADQLAGRSFELTEEQFKAGSVNYLSLLNAEQAKEQTKLSLVQAKAKRYADTAALFQALGGGWWNPPSVDDSQKTETNAPSIQETSQ